jgi:hypothetical protein
MTLEDWKTLASVIGSVLAFWLAAVGMMGDEDE